MILAHYGGPALAERIARGKRDHGERFDSSALESAHPSILDAYASGLRVRVTRIYPDPDDETFTRTGIVSTTTGWRPSFLLMHRAGSIGSWDVLDAYDQVTHTWRGRAYVEGTPYGRVYPVVIVPERVAQVRD
jgi:hypothetical protein